MRCFEAPQGVPCLSRMHSSQRILPFVGCLGLGPRMGQWLHGSAEVVLYHHLDHVSLTQMLPCAPRLYQTACVAELPVVQQLQSLHTVQLCACMCVYKCSEARVRNNYNLAITCVPGQVCAYPINYSSDLMAFVASVLPVCTILHLLGACWAYSVVGVPRYASAGTHQHHRAGPLLGTILPDPVPSLAPLGAHQHRLAGLQLAIRVPRCAPAQTSREPAQSPAIQCAPAALRCPDMPLCTHNAHVVALMCMQLHPLVCKPRPWPRGQIPTMAGSAHVVKRRVAMQARQGCPM